MKRVTHAESDFRGESLCGRYVRQYVNDGGRIVRDGSETCTWCLKAQGRYFPPSYAAADIYA